MKRYVIIGMGAAGISAAETIRSEDPAGEIIMLSEETDGYYSRPGLAYLLTGEIDERMLSPISDSELFKLRIKHINARIDQIYPDQKKIQFSTGAWLKFDTLLIATGAAANRPTWPGIALEGVHKLDSIADARNLMKNIRKIRSAVVIGGGITALELVEGIRARKKKVHFFLRRDRYWSNVLDATESRIVEGRLKEEGVQIHYHTEASEILGKRGRVDGIRTTQGDIIKCQLLAIAVGIRPRIELAVKAGLETDRGIIVNETLQTTYPNIYAAGDVAQVYDPRTGKKMIDSLWGPAREQGIVAGKNMTGQQVVYIKEMPFNVTRLAGLTTTMIGQLGKGDDPDLTGIARGDSETWRELPDAIAAQSHFKENRIRIELNHKYILGAIIMGDQTLSAPLQTLISKKVDISEIRGELIDPNNHPAEVLSNFWTRRHNELI
jgi:NAD(P)H-nitrite reductase large subunit